MSFYRKYRPQIISEIDNVAVRGKIIALLSKDKSELPHAYMLSGPKGVGKTTVSRLIAKIFNCQKLSKTTGPCGKCDQCLSIAKGNNLDVVEIDAASNRGIDEIRLLREQIGRTPAAGEFTVYIIDEVHMLTTEAFNALLKTLEEPPVHAIFILATTDPQKVPETIKSRCVQYVFSKATKAELTTSLSRILATENVDIDSAALDLLTELADGSFRDAAKLIEQLSFEKGHINTALVTKILGSETGNDISKFIELVRGGKIKEAFIQIESYVSEGRDIRQFMLSAMNLLESLLVSEVMHHPESPLVNDYRKIINLFTRAYADMRFSPIPQLPLEAALAELLIPNTPVLNQPSTPPVVAKSGWILKTVKADVSDLKPNEVIQNQSAPAGGVTPEVENLGLITIEKLIEYWKDVIESVKPYNNSVAGVLRSSKPKSVEAGIVTIETPYTFHLEKLSEVKTKEILCINLKKLFGEKVKVQIVLGKK